MPPLTLGAPVPEVPGNFPALLDLLASRPQPAVVWYGGSEAQPEDSATERVELSGRVLQNWAVKMIGLFGEETELDEDDVVLIDAAPHWKAAAVVLAAGALGGRVHLSGAAEHRAELVGPAGMTPHPPALVVTDRPEAWIDGELAGALGDAELAALSPGLLDASFEEATGRPVPAWVLDVSAEVRQHPDQLLEPLRELPLPEPGEPTPGAVVVPAGAQPPRLQAWRALNWTDGVAGQLLGVWAHSGTVVLFGADPADAPESWTGLLRNENPG